MEISRPYRATPSPRATKISALPKALGSSEKAPMAAGAAAELLSQYGPLSGTPMDRYADGRLDELIQETLHQERVLYLRFPVTVPAGGSAEVECAFWKAPSYDFGCSGSENEGLQGYDLVTRLGSSLNFTRQSAALVNAENVQITGQDFGFDPEGGVTPVELDLEQEHYYLEVRPVEGQIDDLLGEINERAGRGERVLVTTLTKKMAEDLTEYFKNAGIKVRYMHSDVQTIERMEIIRDLRLGEFDVLVGINLLREGLDLPEVSLVAILDADKEGFLRSETSLIQTIGRAARNAEGLVILYADTITPSMRAAMDETERRRGIQDRFNQEHGIVPKTIIKGVREVLEISTTAEDETTRARRHKKLSQAERDAEIKRLEKEMKEASKMLEFEYAAVLRDRIIELRGEK